MKAKTQEISVLTIEEKTVRQASLTADVEKTNSEFSEDGTTLLPSDMVTLLKAEQRDNDSKKAYCIESFGETEDAAKDLAHQVAGRRGATEEHTTF